jgi:hypothetical protein
MPPFCFAEPKIMVVPATAARREVPPDDGLGRGIQYAASRTYAGASGILDRPLEPVIGLAVGETRWRTMTKNSACPTRY